MPDAAAIPEHRFGAELAWADAHVVRTGPPVVRERPWASVLRLPTADGPVWLKITTAVTRYEVDLYGLLVTHVPDHVLRPLARDETRGLLLLPDGGRTVLDGPAERVAERVTAAVEVYASLQRALAGHDAELRAAGVPDASPSALVDRFDEAVAAIGAPVGGPDVSTRRALVAGWAAELAAGPAGDLVSVDHQDLHAGNVLVDPDRYGPGRFRFYDWGDATLAHPFASLVVALGGLARVLDTTVDDPLVMRARDAYLTGFADLAGPAELVATAGTACRAAIVARALTWQRAVSGGGPDAPFADAPRRTLAAVGVGSPFAVV